ncbi:MAG: PcfJ domain-containing protein [Candidatus Coproplasma sp.]
MRISSKIPSDILKKIIGLEGKRINGRVIYYPYFELQDGELAISTVGVKAFAKKIKGVSYSCLFIKKATVHIVGHSECYYRDITFTYLGGYQVDYSEETKLATPKNHTFLNHYCFHNWACENAKYFRVYNTHNRIINLDFLQTLPEYKYCGYDGSVDALDYLNNYRKNPKIELITKLVSPRLASSKAICNLAAKDKQFVTWLKLNAAEINNRRIGIPTILRAYRHNESFYDAENAINLGRYLSGRNSYNWNERTLPDYLFKSNEQHKKERLREYMKANKITAEGYIDYIKALKELKIDLTDSKNLFPNDWEYWLNVRLNQYATKQAEKNEKGKKALDESIKAVADKYAMLGSKDGDYVAILADSKSSLIFEGEILHHCVGRMDYDQRIIKEQSLIVFIRTAKFPDTPLVTVEFSLSQKKVLQCYGDHDTKPSEAIRRFVYDKWEPQAQKVLQAMKKKKAA